jgi:predicted transcriptional regulator
MKITEKYEMIFVDEIVMEIDIEQTNQLQVTVFYENQKFKDKEWNFILSLN